MPVLNRAERNRRMTDQEKKKQERQAQRKQFSSMAAREKWQHFKDYYMKGTIIGVIGLVLLVGLVRDVWRGSRECVFYALVINQYTEVPDSFREGFISYAGLDDRKYNILIDTTMKMDLQRQDEMTMMYLQEIIAIASTRKQDLFLADEQVIDYYWDAGYIVDLREVLPEQFWKTYEKQFYYQTDGDGNHVPVGIYVGDSPKLAEYDMYTYQNPIVSVVYQAPDVENIQAFVSYLYE